MFFDFDFGMIDGAWDCMDNAIFVDQIPINVFQESVSLIGSNTNTQYLQGSIDTSQFPTDF